MEREQQSQIPFLDTMVIRSPNSKLLPTGTLNQQRPEELLIIYHLMLQHKKSQL